MTMLKKTNNRAVTSPQTYDTLVEIHILSKTLHERASQENIAKLLGITQQAVQQKINRIRKDLNRE